MQVEIDLDLNAYANARKHFESRKAKAAKQQKTVDQNEKALRAAEKTAQFKLTQVHIVRLPGGDGVAGALMRRARTVSVDAGEVCKDHAAASQGILV